STTWESHPPPTKYGSPSVLECGSGTDRQLARSRRGRLWFPWASWVRKSELSKVIWWPRRGPPTRAWLAKRKKRGAKEIAPLFPQPLLQFVVTDRSRSFARWTAGLAPAESGFVQCCPKSERH